MPIRGEIWWLQDGRMGIVIAFFLKCCKLLDGERFFSFNLDDLGHDRVAEVFSCPANHTTQFFFVQPWIAFDSAQVVGLQARLDGHLPSSRYSPGDVSW